LLRYECIDRKKDRRLAVQDDDVDKLQSKAHHNLGKSQNETNLGMVESFMVVIDVLHQGQTVLEVSVSHEVHSCRREELGHEQLEPIFSFSEVWQKCEPVAID